MESSKQEHWSGFPCPLSGDLPDPEIEPASLCLLHWQADSLPTYATWEVILYIVVCTSQPQLILDDFVILFLKEDHFGLKFGGNVLPS